MELKDRIAVITGGASGIGEGLAERFHEEGARHVVVADLDGDGARTVADRIGGTGVALDVTDEAAIQQLVADTEAAHGGIDLFFSNAGFVTVGGLEVPNEEFQRMWEVHVMAHVYAARAVIPGMAARGGGAVVNTASAAGLLSQIGSVAYSVTKHAAVSLAEWIAISYAHLGIQVAVLCPQAVETKIVDNSPSRDKMGGGFDVAAGDGILQPTDVAEVVVQGLRENRFWALPHPEVAEYAKRKAGDVDRWLAGMQRFQERLFRGRPNPGEWLVG